MKKKIIFTDLDGTLFQSDSTISKINYNTLVKLGEMGVIRVIVTGRSFYSAKEVLPLDFPIDYLVFSSGAGVVHHRTGKILAKKEIQAEDVQKAISYFHDIDVDFMIHEPIPENHIFDYVKSSKPCADARRRIKVYEKFAKPLQGQYEGSATQLLAIADGSRAHLVEHAEDNLPNLSIIRATSPLDHKSIWIEIFPKGIDKGYACRKVIKKLGYREEQVLVIGNDFNDLAMLEAFEDSYVVANAHQDLKDRFNTVASNDDDGFTEMVSKHF
jgi:Cof subfamily protein (haloacid dehalogenase superfamily)